MVGDTDLQKFRIDCLPAEICYIPDFISKEEEKSLMENIYNVPQTRWTNLKNRRLQNWGGSPHVKGMIEEAMPRWLTEVCNKVSMLNLYDGRTANHVLINEYMPGQGIMPHTDGPLYHPAVAIISMASGCLLDFFEPFRDEHIAYRKNESLMQCATPGHPSEDQRLGSVYLLPRSLIVFKGSAYKDCLHGIRETSSDIVDDKVANCDIVGLCSGIEVPRLDTRVSMTIRVVLKTVKASKIFGKGK